MAARQLHQLTRAAQARNSWESITGVVLYDRSRFFQWLEGPPAGIDRVMRSINNDGRHTDLVMLSKATARDRMFADWDLRLVGASVGPGAAGDVMRPTRTALAALRRTPDQAPGLLEELATGGEEIADLLRTALLQQVVPELKARRGAVANGVDRSVAALVAHLLAFDTQGASAMLATGMADLAEAAARALGDRWSADACSEFDVTLGLCCLRSALRALPGSVRAPASAPRVLVVPQPGELHAIGPALHGNALYQAGWTPRIESPADDAALTAMLARERFDCLDLSLSAAFVNEDAWPLVSRTIAAARRASLNNALTVVVNGRAASEVPGLAARVGADAVCRSASAALDVVRRAIAGQAGTTSPNG